MNHKIREFLSKHEKSNLIVYPKGASYVEKETISDIFKRKSQTKIIKISVCGVKKNKRK